MCVYVCLSRVLWNHLTSSLPEPYLSLSEPDLYLIYITGIEFMELHNMEYLHNMEVSIIFPKFTL